MNLGPAEIGLVVLAVMLLFGYKKLPDASRSLGRSLRILKGEMNDLRDDPWPARATDMAQEPVGQGEEPGARPDAAARAGADSDVVNHGHGKRPVSPRRAGRR
ncbi:sec-independent protein translocase protein TatA [Geodermatophilus bullaregiensis]|uniref:twin-arginine translocase TatA/TatE family subunit n=1 Tax=Geodermatophilus bullaregiensis TaxID=1564160 RepID=UPI00195EB44F|nr:twin-arginine translocase TatA/TatE family subunit [Geodermatophilus bullaregiensis]MBM7805007.1 sec-independent protein translocase protein TatA [Geodermatophilus bullaregiensis]